MIRLSDLIRNLINISPPVKAGDMLIVPLKSMNPSYTMLPYVIEHKNPVHNSCATMQGLLLTSVWVCNAHGSRYEWVITDITTSSDQNINEDYQDNQGEQS